jgi:hypothetical protein
MLKGIQAAMRPATAPPVVRAAIARTFTSGTTTSFTFALTGLAASTTYFIKVVSGTKATNASLTGLTVSGGTGGTFTVVSGSNGSLLRLITNAGITSVTGLVITTGVPATVNAEYSLFYALSVTPTKYVLSKPTLYYDSQFGSGWVSAKPKLTTVTGNQVVTSNLRVNNKIFSGTITADTDVVLNGVSLFTALSSYLLPPASKQYLPYSTTTITGLQNTYVALTTNPSTGILYGITSNGKIYTITVGYTSTPDVPYTFFSATETKILDLTNESVANWVNETPLVYSGQGIVDFCFDTNQLTTELGGGFYIMDTQSVIWVALQDGNPIGSYLFPEETTPPTLNAIETNADSTELYFISISNSGQGVFIYSADPYSVLTPGEGDGYAVPPTLLYSDAAGKYGGFIADDLAFNKTNGLLYCILSNLDQTQATKGYILSITTKGVVVQAATNSVVNSIPFSYAVGVDSTGAIAVIGTDYTDGKGLMYVVPANFIGVPSAYTKPFGEGIVPPATYSLNSVAGGTEGNLFVLDGISNKIFQLIPA